MSLDEIRKSIDKDAKVRADSIREEGAAEAAAILKDARAKAAEILKASKIEAQKDAERIKREQISGVQMEISSMFVNAREAVLERHMQSLKKGITAQLTGKNLDKVVGGAARQFTKFASKNEMVVRVGKKNAAIVKRLGYQPVSGKENDLSIESNDGSISIDASPNGLADRHAPEARALLASKLWKVKD
jgi:V/A-type H+-transporting ATPase subunit E